jgi:hypothetical protein
MQPYIQCIQCGLPVVFHQTIWHIHGRAQGVVSQHYLQDRVTMPHWYFTSDIASELVDSVTSAEASAGSRASSAPLSAGVVLKNALNRYYK